MGCFTYSHWALPKCFIGVQGEQKMRFTLYMSREGNPDLVKIPGVFHSTFSVEFLSKQSLSVNVPGYIYTVSSIILAINSCLSKCSTTQHPYTREHIFPQFLWVKRDSEVESLSFGFLTSCNQDIQWQGSCHCWVKLQPLMLMQVTDKTHLLMNSYSIGLRTFLEWMAGGCSQSLELLDLWQCYNSMEVWLKRKSHKRKSSERRLARQSIVRAVYYLSS